jgi:predicted NUDIX family phosphoesterase
MTTTFLKSTPSKHTEFILAVENSYFMEYLVNNKLVQADGQTFQRVVPFDFKAFCQDAIPYLVISQRAALEKNSKYRQLLPYFMIRKMDLKTEQTMYMNYWRAKQSGESRLLGGRSVGGGGHIEVNDIVPLFTHDLHAGPTAISGSIDLASTILLSQDREADEEFILKSYTEPNATASSLLAGSFPTHLIISNDPVVGVFHVGLVTDVEMFPTDELTSGEEGAVAIAPFATIEELMADPKLEDWSSLYLQYVIDQNAPSTPADFQFEAGGDTSAIEAQLNETGEAMVEMSLTPTVTEPATEEEKLAWIEMNIQEIQKAERLGLPLVASALVDMLRNVGIVVVHQEDGITWQRAETEPAASTPDTSEAVPS